MAVARHTQPRRTTWSLGGKGHTLSQALLRSLHFQGESAAFMMMPSSCAACGMQLEI